MKIKTNQKFEALFNNSLSITEFIQPLNPGLEKVLFEEIQEADGCFYYKHLNITNPYSKDLIDRTGNECFFNKLQIDEYCDETVLPTEMFYIGIAYAIKLKKKLSSINTADFEVILSFDGEFCQVTFHKVRVDEKWLPEDINKNTSEAILAITSL